MGHPFDELQLKKRFCLSKSVPFLVEIAWVSLERLRLGLTGRVDTTSHFPPRAMSAMLRAPAAVAFRGDHHAARDTRRVRASASSDVDRPDVAGAVSWKPTRPIVSSAILAAVTGASPASALEVWRYPDGSNPLEALFAGPSPIPFVTGELTGVWFGDLFAYMNLALLLILLAASAKPLDGNAEDE